MMLRRAVISGTVFLLAALAASASVAAADQYYTVDGRDVYKIGTGDSQSRTSYHGTERLTVERKASGTVFVARVDYEKDGDGGKKPARASYTSTLLPSGELRDGDASDPDYLTVLNQPFAVQLDAPTLRDLSHVKRPVPFDFPSPMTGATLRGSLRRLPDGVIGGVRCLGVAFEAAGPLRGALPDRPSLALAGTMTMRGTAYYAYDTALLLALDATLSIDGNLDAAAKKSPVSIVYQRSIRPAAGQETAARPTATPLPTAAPSPRRRLRAGAKA